MTQTQELLAKTTPHEQRQRRTLQGSTDFDFIGAGPLLLKFFLGQVTPAKDVLIRAASAKDATVAERPQFSPPDRGSYRTSYAYNGIA